MFRNGRRASARLKQGSRTKVYTVHVGNSSTNMCSLSSQGFDARSHAYSCSCVGYTGCACDYAESIDCDTEPNRYRMVGLGNQNMDVLGGAPR